MYYIHFFPLETGCEIIRDDVNTVSEVKINPIKVYYRKL